MDGLLRVPDGLWAATVATLAAIRYTERMLQAQTINDLAMRASVHLPMGAVAGVSSSPDFGPDGEETIRVMFVIRAAEADRITGRQVVDTLFELQELLASQGEARFAVINYTADDELPLPDQEDDGGP